MNIHSRAVEAAVVSKQLAVADGPLVELCRTLAAQVDAAGPEGPGTRLATVYGIAVGRLLRRLDELPDAEDRPPSKLSLLRAEVRSHRGGAA
jgi:hypothetical protein